MKLIRTLALGAALCAAAATSAVAQSSPPQQGAGREGGRRGAAALLRGIELTEPQKAQADSINAKFRAMMPAFVQGEQPDSASRAKRMEVMGKQQEALRLILTDEQKKVFDANVSEMRNRMGPPRNPGLDN